MTQKDLFIKALNTLFYAWGGDTPPEAFWAGNNMLVWYEAEYGINLGIRFDEENSENFAQVIEAIRNN